MQFAQVRLVSIIVILKLGHFYNCDTKIYDYDTKIGPFL